MFTIEMHTQHVRTYFYVYMVRTSECVYYVVCYIVFWIVRDKTTIINMRAEHNNKTRKVK